VSGEGQDFGGLVAVVTGGASGIGRATAEMLAARGARVGVIDLVVESVSPPLHGFVADVADDASITAAITAVAGELGGIDVLINNAGIGAVGTVDDFDAVEWRRVLEINLLGIARVSAAALPWLRKSSAAAIVNTSSIAARNGLPQRALYSASKGAVLSLTLAMAADHIGDGIRVNCVCPGTAATPWVDRLLARTDDPAAELIALTARQPMGRLVEPAEIANAIAYLASPASASTTGTVLDVDGGVTSVRVRR
jgi:2-keto-3-deoxy-L-fuconate dehydrogenase